MRLIWQIQSFFSKFIITIIHFLFLLIYTESPNLKLNSDGTDRTRLPGADEPHT